MCPLTEQLCCFSLLEPSCRTCIVHLQSMWFSCTIKYLGLLVQVALHTMYLMGFSCTIKYLGLLLVQVALHTTFLLWSIDLKVPGPPCTSYIAHNVPQTVRPAPQKQMHRHHSITYTPSIYTRHHMMKKVILVLVVTTMTMIKSASQKNINETPPTQQFFSYEG